jgi:hypothetical protein
VAVKPFKSAMTIDEFGSKHDKAVFVPTRIIQTLKMLGDAGMYEIDFLREAKVSATDIAAFREQFDEHIVVVRLDGKPKNVWFGNKATAAKARDKV